MAEAPARARREDDLLVEVEHLAKLFDVSPPFLNRLLQGEKRVLLTAVDDVSFRIPRGKTFSLVGESGCGKSTVARLVVGLHRPTRGRIVFEGVDMAGLEGRGEAGPLRKRLQMIFQDPYASLNPRWRVADIIADGVKRGEFAVEDPHRTAEVLFQATTRFHNPLHAADWRDPKIDADFDALWSLLTRGMETARPAAAKG